MDRLASVTVLLAVVSTAAAVGAGAWLSEGRLAPPPAVAAPGGGMPDQAEIERRVARLEDRLAEKPDDLAGWKMLGRSYMALGRLIDAVGAFSRAAQIAPNDPEARGGLAELQQIARSRGKHDEAIRADGAAAKP